MKIVETEGLPEDRGLRLGPRDTFAFACHEQLDCFNQCCRNLNLFLYPYDVLRLKNRLGMTAGDFIDTHVELVLREGNHFPEVMLAMADNPEKTCPFLTASGCSVYADRSYSCRLFPVEEAVSYEAATNGGSTSLYFFRPPDFCRGGEAPRRLTPEQWIADQQAQRYVELTRQWGRIKALFADDPWQSEGPYGPRAKMAFMAAYNVDDFRDFVFQSSFLKRFKVKAAVLKKLRASDVELMLFGWQWLRFYVWNMPSTQFRMK